MNQLVRESSMQNGSINTVQGRVFTAASQGVLLLLLRFFLETLRLRRNVQNPPLFCFSPTAVSEISWFVNLKQCFPTHVSLVLFRFFRRVIRVSFSKLHENKLLD